MNPETRFSRSFRKKFKPGHNMRVANPACPGTPDINDCINGVEFWVETKRIDKMPKRSDTQVFRGVMRPEQKLWLKMRSDAGGRCYIAAKVEDTGDIFIIPGSMAYEFEAMTLSELIEHTVPMEKMWERS